MTWALLPTYEYNKAHRENRTLETKQTISNSDKHTFVKLDAYLIFDV